MANLSTAAKVKLIYFDLPGLGEVPRVLLKIGGIAYEDFRYPITWVDGKPVRPEFDAAKASLPFGQLPVLEVDGKRIPQSRAIERYIAQQIGLLGSCTVSAGLIDGFGEQILDVRTAYYKAAFTQPAEAKKAALEAFYGGELGKQLDTLEKAAGSDGFFVGGKLSLADVQFYTFVEVVDQPNFFRALLASHPKLKAIYENVAGVPAVAVYKKEVKPKYKLVYFDIRGYAETSRWLLKIAGLPFTDVRFPIAFVDGKPVRPEFDAAKAAGAFPFGQIPVLELESGVQVAQSRAIERFVAREAKLNGGDAFEAALVDSFGEQILDLRSAFFKAFWTQPEDAKKAALDAYFGTDLPKHLGLLEANGGGDGFLVGGKLSLADVQLATALETFGDDKLPAILGAFPKLKKVVDGVFAIPAIAKWRAERKVTAL